MANCLDCRMCQTHVDPDPDDWFCNDDMAARCSMSKEQPTFSGRGNPVAKNPYITVAARPYQLRSECEVPSWCPNHGEIIPK